jgi:alkylation response protein AidB-like acyl-CoA dehydrogenase
VDLSFTEDEQLLQTTVRSFVEREATTEALTALQDTESGTRPEWQRAMADAGWLGAVLPPSLDGSGASVLETALICEELGRGPVPGPFLASSVVSSLLIDAAPPSDHRDELLVGIANGDVVLTPVLVGPGREWDGLQPISPGGSFGFVPYVDAATHLLIPIAANSGHSIDFSVVAIDTPGVSHRRLGGFLAWNHEVTLTEESSSSARVISGGDVSSFDDALSRAYVLIAAYQIGGCQAVLERSIDYSSTRTQFAQPIGRFQRVQDHIVELLNALDAARWTNYEAIWHLDTNRPATVSTHLAKAVASESYLTCTDFAHKVHGGIGVDPQYGLTLYTQMARSLYEFLGHPRWHRRRMFDALVPTSDAAAAV